MRRALVPLALLVGLTIVAGMSNRGRQAPTRLAVVLVIDQLRADLLDRYDDLFEGGFRRLRDEGFRFTNATHDHWWTETAAGHTAIATGAYPSQNGVPMNQFFYRDADAIGLMYSFADTASPILGAPHLEGRSPVNMRRPSLSEWLVWQEPRARVATVSRKDRAAIPLAGHTPATALWVDIESGRFVTSEYYATSNPEWLDDFNTRVMPFLYSDSTWVLRVPPAAVSRARRDSASYENGGRDVTFPHAASERPGNQSYNAWMAETPVPDLATLMLARRLVDELELGRQGHLDFLGISLSQTDAIGHNWGPLSLEQLDNLLRMDHALGEFMDWLDDQVGAGRWMLALSADHGVMTAPEYVAEQGGDAWRWTREQSREVNGLFVGLSDITDAGARTARLEEIEASPLVADVVPLEAMRTTSMPVDSFLALLRNSYVPDRGPRSLLAPPEIVVRSPENSINTRSDAATHGSPYYYDRHVPLVFMGPGIRPGTSADRAATVDLAPTLAELLGVPVPAGIDGVSRASVMRR
jgi:predicted AlkP superfamily pyrophosphatase or phosphodiesterase